MEQLGKIIKDLDLYKDQLSNRLDPSMSIMQGINAKIRKKSKRVIFAEGEEKICLSSNRVCRNKLGIPILIGAEKESKNN